MFLSRGGFPERGAGRPIAAAATELAVSMSCASGHHFHNGPSCPRAVARCRVPRKSCHPFTREARRLPRSIASAARFVLDLSIGVTAGQPKLLCGRSGTFTGQCGQPFLTR
jgi:hypothetical protein